METEVVCLTEAATILKVDRFTVSGMARRIGLTFKPVRRRDAGSTLNAAKGLDRRDLAIIERRLAPVEAAELASA